MATEFPSILKSRHPEYLNFSGDWIKWRLTYKGGEDFLDTYLERFSKRETKADFQRRREMTPTPTFAKTAINDIRNSIFQRLSDVVRSGGSLSYQKAVAGEEQGVDLRGSTMNYFLGNDCLTELLVMGKVGVFVDAPEVTNHATLADVHSNRPYLYRYCVEDILSYSCSKPEQPSEFQSILLRDRVTKYDDVYSLPCGDALRYRLAWVDKETGFVKVQFYDVDGKPTDRDGNASLGPIQLNIRRIPFVLMDIGDSLIKDVCQHQIAMLNLASSDVSYALQSNFPFYVEQRDNRKAGGHLKTAASDGSATEGGQGANEEDIKVGVTQGRYIDNGVPNMPKFIAPPAEPLTVSMALQDRMEQQIRKLVNLAVANLSKEKDPGLEAGLSFIGLVMEGGERRIADFWSTFENSQVSKRQTAAVKYPTSYSLKSDDDRIEQASSLSELISSLPSRSAKREVSKMVAQVLLSGKVNVDRLTTINQEIDEAPYTTSDPKVIEMAKEQGLCSSKTASMALGFEDDEYIQAETDHLERIKRIAQAQGVERQNAVGDPASRGVADLSADPANAGKGEKELSRNTDLQDTTRSRVRGEGQDTPEE